MATDCQAKPRKLPAAPCFDPAAQFDQSTAGAYADVSKRQK
jgi:hypothetical protein